MTFPINISPHPICDTQMMSQYIRKQVTSFINKTLHRFHICQIFVRYSWRKVYQRCKFIWHKNGNKIRSFLKSNMGVDIVANVSRKHYVTLPTHPLLISNYGTRYSFVLIFRMFSKNAWNIKTCALLPVSVPCGDGSTSSHSNDC